MKQSREQHNKELGIPYAIQERDYATAEGFWSPHYIQHSAHIEAGREGLFNLVRNTPSTLRYEHGLILAKGDSVMVHGRFSGFGHRANWIAVDIVRIQDGVLAEHWDVLQDEVTEAQSKERCRCLGQLFQPTSNRHIPAVAERSTGGIFRRDHR